MVTLSPWAEAQLTWQRQQRETPASFDGLRQHLQDEGVNAEPFIAIEEAVGQWQCPFAALSIASALGHATSLPFQDSRALPLGECCYDTTAEYALVYVSDEGQVLRRADQSLLVVAENIETFLELLAAFVAVTQASWAMVTMPRVGAHLGAKLTAIGGGPTTAAWRGDDIVVCDGDLLGLAPSDGSRAGTGQLRTLIAALEHLKELAPAPRVRVRATATTEDQSPPCDAIDKPEKTLVFDLLGNDTGFVWVEGETIEQVTVRHQQLLRWDTITENGTSRIYFGSYRADLSEHLSATAARVFETLHMRRDVHQASSPRELRQILRARGFPVFEAALAFEAAAGGLTYVGGSQLGIKAALSRRPDVAPRQMDDQPLIPISLDQLSSSLWIDPAGQIYLLDATGVAEGGIVAESWLTYLEQVACFTQRKRSPSPFQARVDVLAGALIAERLALAAQNHLFDNFVRLWGPGREQVLQVREVVDYWPDRTTVTTTDRQRLLAAVQVIHDAHPNRGIYVTLTDREPRADQGGAALIFTAPWREIDRDVVTGELRIYRVGTQLDFRVLRR